MELIHEIKSFLLVSIGAVIGSNIRFITYKTLEKIYIKRSIIIFIINNLASFLLGLTYAILKNYSSYKYSYQLALLFVIGLLGSMSTFSAFINNIFKTSYNFKFLRTTKIFILSIFFSFIFLTVGYLLGNQQ